MFFYNAKILLLTLKHDKDAVVFQIELAILANEMIVCSFVMKQKLMNFS